MRRLTQILMGATLAGGFAAPALAQSFPDRDIRDDVRAEQQREARGDARERWEDAQERREDARERWEDRQERREDWRERREDWRDRNDHDRDRWSYRSDSHRYPYRGNWTPYGFGYRDHLTMRWAFRHFDRNHNGKLSEREWRDAQRAFYSFADRNRDGYISRREYNWAYNQINGGYYGNYGSRW